MNVGRIFKVAERALLLRALDIIPRVPAGPDHGAVLQRVPIGFANVPRAVGVGTEGRTCVHVTEFTLSRFVGPAGPESSVCC